MSQSLTLLMTDAYTFFSRGTSRRVWYNFIRITCIHKILMRYTQKNMWIIWSLINECAASRWLIPLQTECSNNNCSRSFWFCDLVLVTRHCSCVRIIIISWLQPCARTNCNSFLRTRVLILAWGTSCMFPPKWQSLWLLKRVHRQSMIKKNSPMHQPYLKIESPLPRCQICQDRVSLYGISHPSKNKYYFYFKYDWW